ncbi:uncharacterized protein LOC141725863 [Zonotrichia albicollis]|uniref:uncharacterized protein LOC141725863 n=1 Tax=Zonotrichia albicollis TaxID=44394 RepID=UPI003D80F20C
MTKSECYFINGTEKVRYVQGFVYNRDQFIMFDSEAGHFVGFTRYGEKLTKRWNSNAVFMEDRRTAVDWFCRCWYKNFTPFITERRREHEGERVPSGPALPVTLEPLKICLGIGPEPSALLVPTPGVSRSSQSLPVPPRASISATRKVDAWQLMRSHRVHDSSVARQTRSTECLAAESACQRRALHSQFLPVPPRSLPVPSQSLQDHAQFLPSLSKSIPSLFPVHSQFTPRPPPSLSVPPFLPISLCHPTPSQSLPLPPSTFPIHPSPSPIPPTTFPNPFPVIPCPFQSIPSPSPAHPSPPFSFPVPPS